jgi:hypothetical protein
MSVDLTPDSVNHSPAFTALVAGKLVGDYPEPLPYD